MGILNITPDSFADGGMHFRIEDALKRADEMIAEGVDIIDIGGESTKPGAERITEDEERKRVIPVISELVKKEVALSIDTTRSNIAKEAIKLGVEYVNDVSGGLADEKMYKVIAENPKVQYIAMHWRAHSKNMQEHAKYADVVKEVKEELENRVESAIAAGVNPDQLIIDPGIGFSKLARLVDLYARRPQVQERLTTQIADSMVEILQPGGVIVIIDCEHLCMSMRGVRKSQARTVTSAVRGMLRDPATRAEAMSLITGK